MTLHQQILTSAPITDRSSAFRLNALACEDRASDASDPTSKQDWAYLAIEWHAMAYHAASMNDENIQIEVAYIENAYATSILPEEVKRIRVSPEMPMATQDFARDAFCNMRISSVSFARKKEMARLQSANDNGSLA